MRGRRPLSAGAASGRKNIAGELGDVLLASAEVPGDSNRAALWRSTARARTMRPPQHSGKPYTYAAHGPLVVGGPSSLKRAPAVRARSTGRMRI